MIRKVLLLISVLWLSQAVAQKYEVKITPIEIENLGGLQSYSVGTHDGEWLLVGGRLDGLHRRQPFASFSPDGRNQDLIVVNPKTKDVWRSPLSNLTSSIQEQLSATNMQFYQDDNRLICTGGYGYSPTAGDHITYPYLTIIDLPVAIELIKNNQNPTPAFTQLEDETFRVTGGGLNKIDGVYYLIGGHKFMGRYNPMGPDHGPGFVQEYTNEVRKFTLNFSTPITTEVLGVTHDELALHRRDYNLVPYLEDNQRKLMIYSGVFQNLADLPWLFPVSISSEEHTPIEDFNQHYNHYHCAFLPIYDESADEMSTLFFGGIAQFYEEDGWLVQDNDVPFVNTIAEVVLHSDGTFKENALADTMPGFLGAGSIFILDKEAQQIDDDILDASTIGNEFQKVGYIYGGIRSSLPNIFWINTGTESVASNSVYEVSIRKKVALSTSNSISKRENLQFYPNPAQSLIRMSITLEKPMDVKVVVQDISGRQVGTKEIPSDQTQSGKNYFVLDKVNIDYGTYLYHVTVGNKTLTRKVIWTE